jgi:hypothetical protein
MGTTISRLTHALLRRADGTSRDGYADGVNPLTAEPDRSLSNFSPTNCLAAGRMFRLWVPRPRVSP